MTKVETVAKLFELTGNGDWDAVAEHMHPDFEVTEPECLPFGGTYRGVAGFAELFRKVFVDTFAEFTPQAVELTEGPNHVVSLLAIHIVTKDGRTLDTRLAEVFRFEDGKLREVLPHYYDTKAIADLF